MFQNYFIRIKVRLNSDLNHYINGLDRGLEGYTLGNVYKNDTYTAVINVYFEKIDTIVPIALDKLNIIDEDYLSFLKTKEEKCLKELKNAKNITKYVGPKGGFKKLTFTLGKEKMDFSDRENALKIEEQLKSFDKQIENITINQ